MTLMTSYGGGTYRVPHLRKLPWIQYFLLLKIGLSVRSDPCSAHLHITTVQHIFYNDVQLTYNR
jgi:hypothetical protein